MNCTGVVLYICALILGMCCLFGYNSFLASPSYMQHYFQYAAVKSTDDVSTLPKAKNSGFWDNIATWVMLIMLIPMFICQLLMLTPCMLKMNLQIRMIAGCIGLIVSMLIVPVCSASGGVSEGGAMAVIIIGAALAGFSTTLLQSSLFGLFGTLPGQYMGGFVLGGGFSGSVNSVLRIIITAASPSTFSGVKNGAVAFFSIGMALMVVTIVTVLLVSRNSIVRQHCKSYQLCGTASSASDEASEQCVNEPDIPVNKTEAHDLAEKADTASGNGFVALDGVAVVETKSDEHAEEGGADAGNVEDASAIGVIKRIWWMMLCLSVTMMTTLALFPGIGLHAMQTKDETAEDTESGTWAKEDLMPIVIILMYNVGDTIGRLLANFPKLWIPKRFVHWLVLARIVVCTIPLALGAAPSKIINSNANPIVIFLVLGVTNGYLIGITMAYGSGDRRLKTEAEKGTAGTVMCFSLLVGMTIGSVLSVLVVTFAFD